MIASPPNIVHDVAAFLRAADRTPGSYAAATLAVILHHDAEGVVRAVWQLKHQRLDRPASWPNGWLA